MKGEYEKRLRRALDEQKSDFEKDMEQTTLLAKVHIFHQDFEILGWSPAGTFLPHGEKVPLQPWLATLLVIVSR